MDKLGIFLLISLAFVHGGLAACSSSSGNGGSASAGGMTGSATGGGSNQGGQSNGGTGESAQVNVGPPCTPDGPTLASLPASATIATAIKDMQAVTLNGSDVYYFDHGVGVFRITGGSGTPTLVVPAPTDTSTTGHIMVGGILQTDGTYVYFAQDHCLYRSALTKPSPELLVTTNDDITQVEIDASYVYYVSSTEGTISRVPVAGSTSEALVTAPDDAQSMELVNGTIYFVNFNAGKVGRLPAAGGTIEWMTPSDTATDSVTVSQTTLYFNDWESLYSVPIGSPNQSTQLGTAGPGLMGSAFLDKVKLVGDRIYWFDAGENVGWTKTDGSQCGLLFKGESFKWVSDFAIASDAVYVTVDNSLLKLPR